MTTTQRVDVETALAEVIRLADVADQLSGDYHESNRAEADLEWAAVNFVREHAKHIAALLQQLAELERSYQESCDITRDWIAANNALSARATEAEAKLAEREAELSELRQACWDARAVLGFDNDGDPTPDALVYPSLVDLVRRDAAELRKDYDEVCAEVCAEFDKRVEAERAREEACAIFAEVIDTVRDAATDARMNHHAKRGEYHDEMAARIAAFLAANGGQDHG